MSRKYRIKEVEEDGILKFYPQSKYLFFWEYYYGLDSIERYKHYEQSLKAAHDFLKEKRDLMIYIIVEI